MRWLAETEEGARTVFRIGRDGDRLVADWPGLGTLRVDRGATRPTFEAAAGADPVLLRKLQDGAMQALLRHLRGELSFHASAVTVRGGAIAFVGDSGAGKSTLAFALASDIHFNFALLSDDCLCVDACLALPTESVGWLDHVARTAMSLPAGEAKLPASPRRVAAAPAPLRHIIQLTYADAFRVTHARGKRAAAILGRAMIRFVLDEPQVHRADLDRLATVADEVEVIELYRPHGFEHIVRTAEMLEQLCAW